MRKCEKISVLLYPSRPLKAPLSAPLGLLGGIHSMAAGENPEPSADKMSSLSFSNRG